MEIAELIQQAYTNSKSYPELVQQLIAAGVQSYTVEVSSGITIYQFAYGEIYLREHGKESRIVEDVFNRENTVQVIRDNQQGKSDYPAFMNGIAKAGVRFYQAILSGDNKRVIYVGIGGHYEERIPVD